MASPSTLNPGPTFLPAGMSRFLSHRASESAGLVLTLAGAAALAALITYAPADPAWNHATATPVANLMGLPGAWLADAGLQTLGLAAGLPALVLLAWGLRLMAHRRPERIWLRLALLPVAMCTAALALAALPVPVTWPLRSALGGFAGDLALGHAVTFGLAYGVAPLWTTLGAATLAIVATLYVLGVRPREWLALARGAVSGVGQAGRLAARGGTLARASAETAAKGVAESGRWLSRGAARLEPHLGSDMLDKPDREPTIDLPGKPRRVAPKAGRAKPGRRAQAARQATLDLPVPSGEYKLPPLSLLSEPDAAARGAGKVNEEALEQNARLLESVLDDFGVRGEIVQVRPGPVVTLYELEPAPGTKTSRVIGLADDIARSMSAVSVRIAVVPGRNVIGIEMPNARRELVHLRELLASAEFERARGGLTLALGKDIGGTPVLVDLARMPHLLIAGTTGSGKSVGVNAMIASLLYRLRPDDVRFIMIDPKMLELSVYDGIPHLMTPVVTDPGQAVVALKWVVREMEDRYRAMSKLGVRNIAGYNQRLAQARKKGEILKRTVQTGFDADTGKPVFEEQPIDTSPLPFIVVVVDEMADLMLVAGKDVEAAIQRLAQMARAAGIHLIMATQRPSVDVVTGTIKANFPTRVSFQVTSKIDSRTILGEQGAEQLLGMGDMLYMAGGGRITRVHGPFMSDEEVEAVVAHLKAQGEPEFRDDITDDADIAAGIPGFDESGGNTDSGDALFDQAVALVARERKASTSFVQRHLQIGYNRAARIIERMEKDGMVGRANHVGKREVLLPPAADEI